MYPAGGYISAEKAKGEKNMNLEEFKKALSSDATEENKQLKKQLSELQKEYGSLKESCQALCNRCFALTKGVTCQFCMLDYPCPHMPSF